MNFLDDIGSLKPLPWDRVAVRIGAVDLSLSEAASLLTGEAGSHLEEMACAASSLTIRRFGRTMKLYAPIYLSNECVNGCLYCGFRGEGAIARRTLSAEEAMSEAERIVSDGHRHILLVSGESPAAMPLEKICGIARVIRPLAASLAVEVQPFDEEGYRRLAEAGVDGVTLYQETYDQDAYRAMHPFGPKGEYCSRSRAIDAAGGSGMRFLNIGALLGLSDWRMEALALIAHARWLMRRHWRSHLSVSVPRIRDCASRFSPPSPVSDRDLAQMICALRLSLPDCGIVLSTREPARLRDGLARLGVTQMSAGSNTEPGGYTAERLSDPPATRAGDRVAMRAGEQFRREDARSAAEVAKMLAAEGYDPVWKDWDRNLTDHRSRSER
ncbi:MAG: 2-iminoacetate synthase ThiH [Proteobacteria bacterium]|nr:2-iminoacetate synthase ThiH [Pseudomonadota bacterium]